MTVKEVKSTDTIKQFLTGGNETVKKSVKDHEHTFVKSASDDVKKRMGFDLRKGGN